MLVKNKPTTKRGVPFASEVLPPRGRWGGNEAAELAGALSTWVRAGPGDRNAHSRQGPKALPKELTAIFNSPILSLEGEKKGDF